jgi:CRISPR type III-associated protein (TIGR04423 family)
MKKNRIEIINYINNLDGYEGYVQFSNRRIDIEKDIFQNGKRVDIKDESGFIYEAHFSNKLKSISIKQINSYWIINETDISNIDLTNNDNKNIEIYIGIDNLKIKMAQIWEEKEDALCENMKVKQLKKVVFVGFERNLNDTKK